jgi:cellulose synthase/poly-beta-1,6-N-acetylglucosamine synthase-like glycosyltransferase
LAEYPPVSVVVAAYNAEKTIGRCIESLLSLDYPNKEVIIVNDGSTDETEKIIKRYPVKLITQSKKGASAARNRGLREAGNKIVAYTDSDCRVSRNWLKKLVQRFKDQSIGAVTGRTVFKTDRHCTSFVRSLDIEERNERRKEYTSLANGPNSAFRRELLLKIGGFNPQWFHAEDTQVSYEIWRAGYKIAYDPNALVYHVPENDWKDFLKKRYRDAKAFTRVLYFHPSQASIRDDFVTPSMKIQPPLFALILLSPLLILPAYLSNFISVTYPVLWLGLFALGVIMNLPFSYKVAKRSGKLTFLIKAPLLTTMRGFCWGLGLVAGGAQNLKNAVVKSSR